MITPGFAHTMARYNAWQNSQLIPSLEALTEPELTQDRGAFFGSIFATLNHLMWGDQMWLFRFGFSPEPNVPAQQHKELTGSLGEWIVARKKTDATILEWVSGLTQETLDTDVKWYSVLSDAQMSTPMDMAVMHFFNHQTHHRGQVHAMLTAAGQPAPVSDIPFMPEG